jgi:hypothetical protein
MQRGNPFGEKHSTNAMPSPPYVPHHSCKRAYLAFPEVLVMCIPAHPLLSVSFHSCVMIPSGLSESLHETSKCAVHHPFHLRRERSTGENCHSSPPRPPPTARSRQKSESDPLTFVIFRPPTSLIPRHYSHCSSASQPTPRSIDHCTMKRATRVLPSIAPVSPLLPRSVQPARSSSPCLLLTPIPSFSHFLATRLHSIAIPQNHD